MRPESCRWVLARLPLAAGGDLVGPERRRVERHLVGCADCRARLVSLRAAVGALHAAAAVPVAAAAGPSIWPALARQIRESRHPGAGAAAWPIRRVLTWGVTGLAAASVLLALALVGLRQIPGRRPGSPTVAQASQRGPSRKVQTLTLTRPGTTRRTNLAEYDAARDPLLQGGPRAAHDGPRSGAVGLSH
jgi:hypothetical protein